MPGLIAAIAEHLERAQEAGRRVNTVELGLREQSTLRVVAGGSLPVPVGESVVMLNVTTVDQPEALSIYYAEPA